MRRYQVGEDRWMLIVTGGTGVKPTTVYVGPAGAERITYDRFRAEADAIAEVQRHFAYSLTEVAMYRHGLQIRVTFPEIHKWHMTCGKFQADITDWTEGIQCLEQWVKVLKTLPEMPPLPEDKNYNEAMLAAKRKWWAVKGRLDRRQAKEELGHSQGVRGRRYRAMTYPLFVLMLFLFLPHVVLAQPRVYPPAVQYVDVDQAIADAMAPLPQWLVDEIAVIRFVDRLPSFETPACGEIDLTNRVIYFLSERRCQVALVFLLRHEYAHMLDYLYNFKLSYVEGCTREDPQRWPFFCRAEAERFANQWAFQVGDGYVAIPNW